jgi:hypothetical protein
MKQKLLLALFILCPLLSFTSCTTENNFDETYAIVGDWIGVNSTMQCCLTSKGTVENGVDDGNIDELLLSKGCVFEGDSYLDYVINPANRYIAIKVTNCYSGTNKIISEQTFYIDYYFEDYDHIVLDNTYEFERYY